MEVEGFKTIKELKLELQSLNILVGANATGKSNFISLFKLLNQMVERNFQLSVRQMGGAHTLLYYGIKNTDRIRIHLAFGMNAYECIWIPTVEDDLIFEQEIIYFQKKGYDYPWNQILNPYKETDLNRESDRKKNVASYVLSNLQDWKVYHFHDTSDTALVKRIGDIHDNRCLKSDASNLAAYLYRLQENFPEHYQSIREVVCQVVPFFDDFVLRPLAENENKIRLEWKEQESDYPFLAHQLSDGTLRFICLATLLLQPHLPSVILMDEPELGLHPYAINVLASLLRSVAQRTQVILSTQSVSLLNQLSPENILIVERKDKATVIERLDPEKLSTWLEEYTLGELWEKNVFGGRPSR
jgi:predicted ATPase